MEIFFALMLVCSASVPFADCTPETSVHGRASVGDAAMCPSMVERFPPPSPPDDLRDPYVRIWCARGVPVEAGRPS